MGELTPRWLDRQDLEVVIRRAAELEAQHGGDAPDLTEADVLRIAGEVGLSEGNVRQALAEHWAATSVEALLVEHGWASRLCGPALVTASRRVSGSAAEVQETLEAHFRTNESLRLVRRLRTGSLWEPEPGVVASIVRSVDVFGHGYKLAKKARAVEVRVVDMGEGECQVTLVADLGNERAGWFWGLGVAGGGGVVAGASALIVGLDLPLLATAATPALLGAMMGVARTGYSRSIAKMRLTLDGLLDRLEHGESLETQRPSWRDLLR